MKFKDIYETAEKILSNNIVKSVLVIALAFLLYKIITALLDARVKHLKKLDRKKSQTYLHLVNSALKYAILVVAFFMLLSVNNVNITSMIAGLGIAGIILGVAVQDALKDIIRGFDIVSDDYFKVGDLVEYKGIEGIGGHHGDTALLQQVGHAKDCARIRVVGVYLGNHLSVQNYKLFYIYREFI